MPPSVVKVNQHLGGPHCLHFQCQGVSQARNQHEAGSRVLLVAYDLFSKMTADFHLTTQHHIPKKSTLLNHHCGNTGKTC
jgi:hypothetical protein